MTDLQKQIGELEKVANPEKYPYEHLAESGMFERQVAQQALSIIKQLQDERDRYKHLWETDSAQAKEIIDELENKSEWENISTAPKDGTAILGSNGKTIFTVAFLEHDLTSTWYILCEGSYGELYSPAIDRAYPEATIMAEYDPTHWMPLPPAPSTLNKNHVIKL